MLEEGEAHDCHRLSVGVSQWLRGLAENLFEKEFEDDAVACFGPLDSLRYESVDLLLGKGVTELRACGAALGSSCSWSCASVCHTEKIEKQSV
jgi:hypothetical protein